MQWPTLPSVASLARQDRSNDLEGSATADSTEPAMLQAHKRSHDPENPLASVSAQQASGELSLAQLRFHVCFEQQPRYEPGWREHVGPSSRSLSHPLRAAAKAKKFTQAASYDGQMGPFEFGRPLSAQEVCASQPHVPRTRWCTASRRGLHACCCHALHQLARATPHAKVTAY